MSDKPELPKVDAVNPPTVAGDGVDLPEVAENAPNTGGGGGGTDAPNTGDGGGGGEEAIQIPGYVYDRRGSKVRVGHFLHNV